MASVVEVRDEDIASWQAEWADIERTVKEEYPTLEGFKADSAAIATMISDGKYMMHHSKIYNQTYNPHYRIVSRKEYNKLKDRLK